MTREEIDQHLQNIGGEVLLMDGFDEACIGFSKRVNEPMLAVYSWQKMVETLENRDEMDYDEAVEYIDYNILGAWVGEKTPIIVMSIEI